MNKKFKKIIVVDVETKGLSARPESFIFGCVLGDETRQVFYKLELLKEFLLSLDNNYMVFAHNAEYDYTCIFGSIIDIDPAPVYSKSSLIMFTNENGCLFCDSLNLLKGSVKEVGEQLGIPKLSLDAKFIEGKTNIKVTQQDIIYCYRDCEIVYVALSKMYELAGIQKPTIASLAYAVFMNQYTKYDWCTDNISQVHYRHSYYGARTEVFKKGVFNPPLYVIDVNSMYPFIMRDYQFPNPLYRNIIKNISIEQLVTIMRDYEGCAEIELEHKKTNVGYLPLRVNGKLLFPTGRFTGVYCFPEIRFALQQGIIKIVKINFVNFSYRIESPFKKFVETYYNLRMKAKGYEKLVYKYILNNLYGKFAQGVNENRTYFKSKDEDFVLQNYNGNEVRYSKDNKTGYTVTKQKHYPYITAPQFSSYVTSHARVFMLQKMLELNKQGYRISYMDTDSFFINKKYPDTGDELGAFKLETYRVNKINNLKDYEVSGVRKVKGIKKNAVLIAPNTYVQKEMIKLKSGLKRGLTPGTFIDKKKVIKNNQFKRVFLNNKNSIPFYLNMLDNLKK